METLEHGFEAGDMILDCHSPRVDIVDRIDADGNPCTRIATPQEALKARILSDPDWVAWLGKDGKDRPDYVTFESKVFYDIDAQDWDFFDRPRLQELGFEYGDRVKVTLEKIDEKTD